MRTKLLTLSESLHETVTPSTFAEWIEKHTTLNDSFYRSWRSEYEKADGNDEARAKVQAIADERRVSLAVAIAKVRAEYQESLSGPSDSTADVALILECEREGAGRAFDRNVGEKLLELFDDARREVVGDG